MVIIIPFFKIVYTLTANMDIGFVDTFVKLSESACSPDADDVVALSNPIICCITWTYSPSSKALKSVVILTQIKHEK